MAYPESTQYRQSISTTSAYNDSKQAESENEGRDDKMHEVDDQMPDIPLNDQIHNLHCSF